MSNYYNIYYVVEYDIFTCSGQLKRECILRDYKDEENVIKGLAKSFPKKQGSRKPRQDFVGLP